jgi:predicted PhzF superfamily epimerase YddE/YHI9
VFTATDGSHGNPLGVFLDGANVPPDRRQGTAAELGYSETVFVDDVVRGRLQIFTPGTELRLAGHPLVGTAWLIAREHGSCDILRPPAGEVPTWEEDDIRWIRARPEWGPEMELREFSSPAGVDALERAPDGLGFVACWAWGDERRGIVRMRVFAADAGIFEDEATGSAALRMGAALGRVLEIHQGLGSVMYVQPGPDGTVEVGGRVLYRGEHSHDV